MGTAGSRPRGWQIQIVVFSLTLLFRLDASLATAEAGSITVCPTCEVTTIQAGVDAAPAGGTIRVLKGVYREPTIIIKKPLRLIGVDKPVIDGNNQQQLLVIFKADDVVIKGFEFKDTGLSFTSEWAGVRVIESHRCQISESTFTNTTYGIYLEKSHQCHISDNRFYGFAKDEASGGNGIHIWTGSEHLVENNVISGHRDGIYLEFVKSSVLKKNEVFGNLRYGLHFMFSNSTQSTGNRFYENGSGVAIMYSQDIVMMSNFFLRNQGNASYGLLLKDIHSSQIVDNQFLDNTVGIYMEGSNRSTFEENTIASNGYGLRIMGNCESNTFSHNNFQSNSFDVTTNSSMSWNTFSENYWSKYSGYDLDKNLIGDVPFRPVSLSSVAVESIESSFYLIGSFLFDLLDFVERALPELTPETFTDESPLINPWPSQQDRNYDKN